MSRFRWRRWLVPWAVLATIAVPALLGTLVPGGGYGAISPDCDGCPRCISVSRSYGPAEPMDLQGEEKGTPADQGEAQEGDSSIAPRQPARPKVPDAVTRPRIDPGQRRSPGYAKPGS
ncbi:MAG TPA: hypothetical protein VKB65_12805 [Myxococcota bacterium]|nr:hypothetical protein [Myxococcota bacterium]